MSHRLVAGWFVPVKPRFREIASIQIVVSVNLYYLFNQSLKVTILKVHLELAAISLQSSTRLAGQTIKLRGTKVSQSSAAVTIQFTRDGAAVFVHIFVGVDEIGRLLATIGSRSFSVLYPRRE